MDVRLLVRWARSKGERVARAGSGDGGHELISVEEPGPELVVGGVEAGGLLIVFGRGV